MNIILVSGKAQSGKDTFANILKSELSGKGQKVLIAHYADFLKFILSKYFDWDGQKDEKGRTLLQFVGTDVIRKKDPNFWVHTVITILKLFPNTWDTVIIPDCRFPNECLRMKEEFNGPDNKVMLVKMSRQATGGLLGEQLKHVSETAMDNVLADIQIDNNGTIEDLQVHAMNIITFFDSK